MLTVLKIGGSLITDKSSEKPKLNLNNIKRISKEIASSKIKGLVLVHGAGSYGHPIVKRTEIHKGLTPEKNVHFAETQRLQNELNQLFCKELINNGVPAFPFQPSSNAVMRKGELVFLDLQNLKGLLSRGLVPVLFGVPVFDEVTGCSILSGDAIVSYLAKELDGRMLFATSVDGVYDSNPEENDKARIIKELNQKSSVFWRLKTTDVTGGMQSKVVEVLKSRKQGFIFNGGVEGNVERALKGQKVIGTVVKGDEWF
jgi:isopentenyl phosphate kinase